MTETLGPYVIEEEIGRGAVGVVYRARHAELDRPVALKVLAQAGKASAQILERFHREALAAAKLRHPNIVTVHDAGVLDGVPFIAMEFLEGGSLADALGRRAFTRDRLIAILAKVADAVDHAHRAGIVHRDLKPDNIFLDTAGEPRVGDFGLAHLLTSSVNLTRTGAVLGTPLYMSPEQVNGDAHRVGPRSDVYALGVILYQCLAGRVPFEGETIETVYTKILASDPPPIAAAPRDLRTVCAKAIEKSPDRRYASARALGDDLRRCLAGEAILARPPSVTYRVVRFLARRRLAVAVLAAVLLAITTAGVARAWLRERAARTEGELLGDLERRLDLLHLRFCQPDFRLTDADFATYGRLEQEARALPPSPRGCHLIARCREVLGDDRGSRDAVESALRLDGEHAPSLLLLARLQLQRALMLSGISGGGSGHDREARREMQRSIDTLSRLRAHSMQADLAGAYLEVVRHWRKGTFRAEDMAARWASDPYVGEFHLLEAISRWSVAPADEAVRRMPSNPHALLWRAVLRVPPACDESIADLTRAIEIHPRLILAYTNRGFAHFLRQDYEAARADYAAALQLDPRSAYVYTNRGVMLQHLGDDAGALADQTRAIELDPQLPQAYLHRAHLHLDAGRLDDAAADCERALAITPGYAKAHLTRGLIHQARGAIPAAIDAMTRATQEAPAMAEAWVDRALLFQAQGRLDEALDDFNRAVAAGPALYDAWAGRGALRHLRGDLDGAIADLSNAIALRSNDPQAYINRGASYGARAEQLMTSGQPQPAAEARASAHRDADRAIELNPKLPQAWTNRGVAKAGAGDFDGAILDHSRAIELAPAFADAWANRGMARHWNRDLDGAAADYRQALAIAPALWPIRQAVEENLRRTGR